MTIRLACLQELLKRLQDRHVECDQPVAKAKKAASDTPNVMQAMILVQQATNRTKTVEDHAKTSPNIGPGSSN